MSFRTWSQEELPRSLFDDICSHFLCPQGQFDFFHSLLAIPNILTPMVILFFFFFRVSLLENSEFTSMKGLKEFIKQLFLTQQKLARTQGKAVQAGKIHGKKNGAQGISDRVCPAGASGGALWEVQSQRKGCVPMVDA